ncbi:MAG: T9SS type A sorting domain-containing protein, partial [Bacteroidota bacterium]
WASDLDDGSSDNCPGDLTFSFSTDVTDQFFDADCEHLGAVLVNIFVTDAAGNQSSCQTFILVQDNQLFCPQPFIAMGGEIANEENESIEGVSVSLSGSNSSTAMTGIDGSFQFTTVEPGGDYSIVPQKDVNPLNGVTTFDLVLISKHILGVQALNSPYKIIAADANHSNSVTTFDLVQLRKLILFIEDDFPNNTSWRFVDKKFVFPNLANPFQTNFPELLNFNNVASSQLEANFIAVKIGDVNGSAAPNLLGGNEDRSTSGNLVFETEDVDLKEGEMFQVNFTSPIFDVSGFQFTLDFDWEMLEFVEVVPGMAKAENFGLTLLEKGAITASWNSGTEILGEMEQVFALKFKAKADAKLSRALHLNSRYTPAEAYAKNGDLLGVQLRFKNLEEADFELFQNTPNPFSDFTTIGFYLPEAAFATLNLTDVSGKKMKVVSGDFSSGFNEVKIKRSDLSRTGVFFYTLETEGFKATRKMILVD